MPDATTLELGRRRDGRRRVELDFTISDCVPAHDVPADFSVFERSFEDLNPKALKLEVIPLGQTLRVVVTADRAKTRAGSYVGTVRIGSDEVGVANATLTVNRQQPFVGYPLFLGVLAIAGGLLVASLENLYKAGATTTELAKTRSTRAKGNWLRQVFRPIGTLIQNLYAVAMAALTIENMWGIVLGLGAGVSAFAASYINDSSWEASLGNSISLIGKVGGATLAAAFAVWRRPSGTG